MLSLSHFWILTFCLQSQALMNAIKEYENNKWKVIGQKVGKPAKVRKDGPIHFDWDRSLTHRFTGLRAICKGALSW